MTLVRSLESIIRDAVDAHDYRTAAEASWVLADHCEQQGSAVATQIRGDARRYLVIAWARDVFDPEREWRDVDVGPRMRGEIRRFFLPLYRAAPGFSRYGFGGVEIVFDRRERLKVVRAYGGDGPSASLQARIEEWWAAEQQQRAQAQTERRKP